MAAIMFYTPSTEADLINLFAYHRGKLEHWFQQRLTKEQIAIKYIGGSTYRRLRSDRQKDIAKTLAEWARITLGGPLFEKAVKLEKQGEYDEWLKKDLCGNLCDYCNQRGVRHANGSLNESYGPMTKIANLFMKHAVCWDELTDNDRARLVAYLHVPFDRDTLKGLRSCARQSSYHGLIGDIKKPGMEFIKSPEQYGALQDLARSITDAVEPKAPPIYLDILFWNVPRLYESAAKMVDEVGGIDEAKGVIDEIAFSRWASQPDNYAELFRLLGEYKKSQSVQRQQRP